MQVSMLVTPAAHLSALDELFAWADKVDIACAWATTGEGKAAHWKCIDVSKVRSAVIGVGLFLGLGAAAAGPAR